MLSVASVSIDKRIIIHFKLNCMSFHREPSTMVWLFRLSRKKCTSATIFSNYGCIGSKTSTLNCDDLNINNCISDVDLKMSSRIEISLLPLNTPIMVFNTPLGWEIMIIMIIMTFSLLTFLEKICHSPHHHTHRHPIPWIHRWLHSIQISSL